MKLQVGIKLKCIQEIYGFCKPGKEYLITSITPRPGNDRNIDYDRIYIKGLPSKPEWISRYQIPTYFEVPLIKTVLPLP